MLAVTYAGPAHAEPRNIEAQRAAFRAVYPEVERGNWKPVLQHERLLADYVLWPDLKASYLRARIAIADHAEIRDFLDEYGLLKPARELRYAFSLHLAKQGHLVEYLQVYREYYSHLGNARLDCIALQALMPGGLDDKLVARGIDLWLTGRSQEDECDPVFAHLRERNVLTDEHYRQRFMMAIDERRFSLARYLSTPLSDDYKQVANGWLDARNNALSFVRSHKDRADDETARQQLFYAIERIAFDDPLLAHREWQSLLDEYAFDVERRNDLDRHIALWAARRHLAEAASLLSDLPSGAVDTEVRRWIIRTSLRTGDWNRVIREIASLPTEEQQDEEWRFWEAMALKKAGQPQPANTKLTELAATRSYYGFLAADALGKDYTFAHNRLIPDARLAEQLMQNPALVRARELFHVGLEGRGRSEWDAAVADMRPYEQVQAAILAHLWGWHSRAIATASLIGEFDDLEIRYPLPWREEFERYAREAQVEDSLVYGIARSESLFMRDIRSTAGAVGLMQVLPETGRRIARELRQPFYGSASLTDKTTNIRIGTAFLKKLLQRFDDNRVLATAAYNAGPLSIDDWLPRNGRIDTAIWIENIPYDETRGYVRRVLTADTIFQWRLKGTTRRLSTDFEGIERPAGVMAQLD